MEERNAPIVLVGCGYMGQEYLKALVELKQPVLVIGNREEIIQLVRSKFTSCSSYVTFTAGGFEKWSRTVDKISFFSKIIIASPIQLLDDHLSLALELGFKQILIEKPGSLNLNNMSMTIEKITKSGAKVYVAYNRRFYPSVIKAKEIIEQDGGVLSFQMNLTELIHRVDPSKYDLNVLNHWIYSMTSHLLDLGFYLGGVPEQISCITHNPPISQIPWHPNATIFTGQGVTKTGAVFSYQGNWGSAGRWRLEICTSEHLIIFCPLEKLQVQKRGEMIITEVNLDSSLMIKMGILEQTHAFIGSDTTSLLSYQDQYQLLKIYRQIANYDS